jgi:hypothetical protein
MSDKLTDSDNTELPSVENVASPYDVPQNNNVLPRNLFTSGTLPGNTVINIGVNNVKIDGKNKCIIINDGTNDRVIIGYQQGGF